MSKKIRLEIYEGVEASVNAYIVSDNRSIILIDCLRNSKEAELLAEKIQTHNKPLTHVLITHGHPDHYLGMGVMKQKFPDVRLVVASEEIKQDIKSFSTWMESVGWLEGEPAMKPLDGNNSSGFDYDENLEVLADATLSLEEGAVLALDTDYLPAESDHLTTVFSEDLNALFVSDFCYNHVHMWLAIDRQNITNWKRQLEELRERWSERNPKIYPGHGQPAGLQLFEEVKQYIIDFEKTIVISGSREKAMDRMVSLYPDYRQADFLLFNSVNALIDA